MFGSCFDENCLVTRAYTLFTGVSFRGTPGSPLFEINSGIQVAVDLHTAVLTDIHTGTQVQRCLDVPTLRTAFRRGEVLVGQDDLTAIPLTLICHLPPELVESHIQDRLCQVMVLHHPTHIQVFQHNC